MGGSISFLETEKKTWIKHTLRFDELIREECLENLQNFQDDQTI